MKIALIGCGAAAERYYVPAIKKKLSIIDDLYLVDLNIEQAKAINQLVGKGSIAKNHNEVIDYGIDGAIITLPNKLHYSVGMDFLKAGIHVLCEKPLADTHAEAREMVTVAESNKVGLCVNNTRRMFPSNKAIRQKIKNKELGAVREIKYTEGSTFGWASATGFYVNPKITSKGLLSDLGPHVIDILCWWLDGIPDVTIFNDDSFGGPESVANVQAEFGDCRIDIYLNRLVDLESSFEIQCEKGKISGKPMDWGLFRMHTQEGDTKDVNIPCAHKNYPSFLQSVFDNFIKVIQGIEKPLISGESVLPSLSIIDKCYEKRNRFKMPWYENIKVVNTPKDATVLITGATGFIGASIAERLHFSKERKVKAVVHNWSNAARIGRFPVDIINMDLMDEDSIIHALDGVDEIVHCAKGPYDVTVVGTENLLKIALKKKVRRFIHLSTTEVYGNREGYINEDTPFEYTGNEYNRMKIDAEKKCWKYVERGLPIVILRPSIVYGPFSKNWTMNIGRLLINKKIGIYEKIGEGKCNLIYINDLINAILLSLDSEKAVGEAFNIVGPEVISWNSYFRLFSDSMNLPDIKKIPTMNAKIKTAALIPVRKVGSIVKDHFMGPVKMVAENLALANIVLRKVENLIKTTPASDELKLFSKNAEYLRKKAKNKIGFNSEINSLNGVKISTQWLRHNRICD